MKATLRSNMNLHFEDARTGLRCMHFEDTE
jgi:hypothetical protein